MVTGGFLEVRTSHFEPLPTGVTVAHPIRSNLARYYYIFQWFSICFMYVI